MSETWGSPASGACAWEAVQECAFRSLEPVLTDRQGVLEVSSKEFRGGAGQEKWKQPPKPSCKTGFTKAVKQWLQRTEKPAPWWQWQEGQRLPWLIFLSAWQLSLLSTPLQGREGLKHLFCFKSQNQLHQTPLAVLDGQDPVQAPCGHCSQCQQPNEISACCLSLSMWSVSYLFISSSFPSPMVILVNQICLYFIF